MLSPGVRRRLAHSRIYQPAESWNQAQAVVNRPSTAHRDGSVTPCGANSKAPCFHASFLLPWSIVDERIRCRYSCHGTSDFRALERGVGNERERRFVVSGVSVYSLFEGIETDMWLGETEEFYRLEKMFSLSKNRETLR